MKQTLDVLNAMETDGVIGRRAMAGAVAASNKTISTMVGRPVPFGCLSPLLRAVRQSEGVSAMNAQSIGLRIKES